MVNLNEIFENNAKEIRDLIQKGLLCHLKNNLTQEDYYLLLAKQKSTAYLRYFLDSDIKTESRSAEELVFVSVAFLAYYDKDSKSLINEVYKKYKENKNIQKDRDTLEQISSIVEEI